MEREKGGLWNGRMVIQGHRGRFAILLILGYCHSLYFGAGPFF